MKILLALLLCISGCLGQYQAKYEGKTLTGLFDLLGDAPNCGTVVFAGTIASIGEVSETGWLYFAVKTRRDERDVEIEVSKLSNADRSNLFHFLVKTGQRVQVSGYTCGSNGVVDPLSIEALPRKAS